MCEVFGCLVIVCLAAVWLRNKEQKAVVHCHIDVSYEANARCCDMGHTVVLGILPAMFRGRHGGNCEFSCNTALFCLSRLSG